MLRVSEGQGTRLPKTRAAQRSTLTSVLQFLGKKKKTKTLRFNHNRVLYELTINYSDGSIGASSCSSSVVSLAESRPASHAPRSHRTPGLQTPPPRRLLSSLPHGPHGMLGKRSYHHHSRAEPERRSGTCETSRREMMWKYMFFSQQK